jgi:hypothetical protein
MYPHILQVERRSGAAWFSRGEFLNRQSCGLCQPVLPRSPQGIITPALLQARNVPFTSRCRGASLCLCDQRWCGGALLAAPRTVMRRCDSVLRRVVRPCVGLGLTPSVAGCAGCCRVHPGDCRGAAGSVEHVRARCSAHWTVVTAGAAGPAAVFELDVPDEWRRSELPRCDPRWLRHCRYAACAAQRRHILTCWACGNVNVVVDREVGRVLNGCCSAVWQGRWTTTCTVWTATLVLSSGW